MEHHGYMISKELLNWIESNVKKGSTILELGSGDGTKLLSENYTMFSVEHNDKWVNKYDSTYIHAPIKDGWFDVNVLSNKLPENYDLILVDAPPAFTEDARMGFLHNIDLFNTNVPIIIDDIHRKGEKKLAVKLSEHLGKPFDEHHYPNKSFAVIK